MDNQLKIIEQLDSSVLSVIGNKSLMGFQKAHVVSVAIGKLKELLTDEFMKPIMDLQGNRLGFLTDKDKTGGYDIIAVRNCLIEAVLMGLQPTGNQFNIIAGNMYPTKEGCGYLLNNYDGLKKSIVPGIPKFNVEKTGAAIDVNISWELNGTPRKEVLPLAIRANVGMGVDAIVGKATRKARAWLLSEVTGTEITDGDVTDITNFQSKTESKPVDHEDQRVKLMFDDCKSIKELDEVFEKIGDGNLTEGQLDYYADSKVKFKK